MHGEGAVGHLAGKLQITTEQARDFQACYLDSIHSLAEDNSNISKDVLNSVDHMGFTDFVFLKESKLFAAASIGSRDGDLTIQEIRKEVMKFLKGVLR